MANIDISPASPWLVQAFLKGTEYSTCAIAHQGKLALFTDNEASISCFNYRHAGNKEIHRWVEKFCGYHQITGIVCIDFIVDATGTPKAIECNPRMSSNITSFYNSPSACQAFLNPESVVRTGRTELPLDSHCETCWTAVDVYYALRKPGLTISQRVSSILDSVFNKQDAYWDPEDIMPFLALHYLHIPVLLARNVWKGNKWAKIDMCIGKLTEENGD